MSNQTVGELTNEDIDIINGTVEEPPTITLNETKKPKRKVNKENVIKEKIKKEKVIKEPVVLGWW